MVQHSKKKIWKFNKLPPGFRNGFKLIMKKRKWWCEPIWNFEVRKRYAMRGNNMLRATLEWYIPLQNKFVRLENFSTYAKCVYCNFRKISNKIDANKIKKNNKSQLFIQIYCSYTLYPKFHISLKHNTKKFHKQCYTKK